MSKTIKAYVRKLYSTEYEEKEIELPDFLTDEQISVIERAVKTQTTILISGKQGSTGKTYLTRLLNSVGIPAVEEHEFERIELNQDLHL